MNAVFAQRLKSARLMKGLSMEALAKAVGISKQMISKYEAAKSIPHSKVLIQLAKALDQKADYFFRPRNIEIGAVEFRKKSSLQKGKVTAIAEQVHVMLENYVAIENILAIESKFINPIAEHKIKSMADVEYAVDKVRMEWEIGFDPMLNIVELLESKGVKVLEIDLSLDSFDGMATYVDNSYPVVVVNKNFPLERKRFTLLHELGHLLLNCGDAIAHKDVEKYCNRFAAAMLLPAKVVVEKFGGMREKVALRELELVQRRYGISIPAIVYRLADLHIITQLLLKRFFIRLRSDDEFRQHIHAERFQGEESSRRFEGLVHRALTQELISISRAASLLGSSVSEVRKSFELV